METETIDSVQFVSERFKIQPCQKNYGRKKVLQKDNEKPIVVAPTFDCKHCQKPFETEESLSIHLLTHEAGEKPLKCDQCDKTFSHPLPLSRHRKTHPIPVPKFECERCHKPFKDAAALEAHSWYHAGEKFVCKVCFR